MAAANLASSTRLITSFVPDFLSIVIFISMIFWLFERLMVQIYKNIFKYCLHAYIKMLKMTLFTKDFGIFSLHNAYTKPTWCLHVLRQIHVSFGSMQQPWKQRVRKPFFELDIGAKVSIHKEYVPKVGILYSQGGNIMFPVWECFIPKVGIISVRWIIQARELINYSVL